MKKISLAVVMCGSLSLMAQKSDDQKAIKAMCGCYEVTFNFDETFKYPSNPEQYKPSKEKHEKAYEWVQLIEDQPRKISMQHLLLAGEEMVIKHWRQEWIFENTKFYDYQGFNNWKFVEKNPKEVQGQWTQKVYEVSDEPRYEGTATWARVDGRTTWRSVANAPLPRREYTQRSDYNVTLRTNEHEILSNGWIHNQDNKKIVRTEAGKDYVLAEEKGYNTYVKVDDSKCQKAKEWWKNNEDFWAKVRSKWSIEFAKNKELKLKEKVDGQPLFVHLGKLKKDASQSEINKTIDLFIIQ
ncbi:MAG: hypothetical protein JSS94_10595 [Bacteroidetes bacterium]|nr:hypothetical protein [Bacteroidota bacterium]